MTHRHLLRLSLLSGDQFSLHPPGSDTEFLAEALLTSLFCLALLDEPLQTVQVLTQCTMPIFRLLDLLCHPSAVQLLMLPFGSQALRGQLRLSHMFLVRSHILIEQPQLLAHLPQHRFLSVLLSQPLTQLSLDRVRFLFQPLTFADTILNFRLHPSESMVKVIQHMLKLLFILAQRQILHLGITKRISELAVLLGEHLDLGRHHLSLLLALIKLRHKHMAFGFKIDHLSPAFQQTRRSLNLTTRHDARRIHHFPIQSH